MTRKSKGERETPIDLPLLVQSAYPHLPENQRKVADVLLERIREVPFLSVIELEGLSGTSKATVVRLAQSLGFSGYHELRERVREGAQSEISEARTFPLLSEETDEETFTTVARQDVQNINQTITQIDREVFARVTQMFLTASRVYTFGLGISSLLARVLSYSLNQVAVRSTPFAHEHETFFEQIHQVTPSDVAVAFSFHPYSRETIDTAQALAAKGVPVVAVTDRVTSPVAFVSTAVLPIASQNRLFTNSISAVSVLINALTTEVALRSKNRATDNLRKTEDLLQQAGHYFTE
ncbi:MAG: MurR/RpiR family transcriptional regulator [Ignavibacteriae bacterium]|nr:MurR/RpiR family transcriptional regulator [Ignavibacteriota bacterium]